MENREKAIEDMKQQVFKTQNMMEQAGLFPDAKPNRRQRRAIERQANKIKNARKR